MFKKHSPKPAPTQNERIDAAERTVALALAVFEKARQDLEQANAQLDAVIADAQDDVDRAQATINSAQTKKLKNLRLHSKFADLSLAD